MFKLCAVIIGTTIAFFNVACDLIKNTISNNINGIMF